MVAELPELEKLNRLEIAGLVGVAPMRKLIIILNTMVHTDQLWRESAIG